LAVVLLIIALSVHVIDLVTPPPFIAFLSIDFAFIPFDLCAIFKMGPIDWAICPIDVVHFSSSLLIDLAVYPLILWPPYIDL
jgi:hypothetical protein